MADGAAITEFYAPLQTNATGSDAAFAVTLQMSHSIEDVEQVWRGLEAGGVVSPGQSYDFIKLWVSAHAIAPENQCYLVGKLDGVPVALLALHRHRRRGVRLLSWFPGPHVGCNAPLVDARRLGALNPAERAAFWRKLLGSLKGADLVYLRAIPETADGLFADLGIGLPVETLYRARFSDWAECNATQRSKSRRKHDRQQGEKLDAMGQVAFEAMAVDDPAAANVLDIMFAQRARRFRAIGVSDPFAPRDVARFYHATVRRGSGVEVKLHVLRLDGAIVAVRYNIVCARRLFCLISSMSDDPAIQAGSPGKQCLLRVMQTVFDEGYEIFDMGAGFTDEKRHWCNEQISLAHHYFPLNPRGRAIIAAHRQWQEFRAGIKANTRLLGIAKWVRGAFQKGLFPKP